MITFIIHHKNGMRESYSVRGDESNEQQVDNAWETVYDKFPEASYIERF